MYTYFIIVFAFMCYAIISLEKNDEINMYNQFNWKRTFNDGVAATDTELNHKLIIKYKLTPRRHGRIL